MELALRIPADVLFAGGQDRGSRARHSAATLRSRS
jgi:hypothetical protein